MFNSLRYTKDLEAVGIPRKQAEAHVQMLSTIMENDVATKQDLRNLKIELDAKFEALEHRIVIKLSAVMGAMFTVSISIAALLFRLR